MGLFYEFNKDGKMHPGAHYPEGPITTVWIQMENGPFNPIQLPPNWIFRGVL